MQQRPELVVGLGLNPTGANPGLGAGSRVALAAVAAFARRARGVRVTLMHATGREGQAWPPRPAAARASRALLIDAEAALAELRAAGAEAELVVTDGAAVPALARRAHFTAADLVVVGRTEGADGRRGLGPTAAALLATAPAPVWVVDGARPLGAVRLVAGARDRAGLGLAAALARALHAPLHVAAASEVPLASAPVCGANARREHFDAARRRLTREAHAACREVGTARVEPEVHVGFDAPRAFLSALAARLEPSLLVVDPATVAGRDTWPAYAESLGGSFVVARGATFVSPFTTSALYERH